MPRSCRSPSTYSTWHGCSTGTRSCAPYAARMDGDARAGREQGFRRALAWLLAARPEAGGLRYERRRPEPGLTAARPARPCPIRRPARSPVETSSRGRAVGRDPAPWARPSPAGCVHGPGGLGKTRLADRDVAASERDHGLARGLCARQVRARPLLRPRRQLAKVSSRAAETRAALLLVRRLCREPAGRRCLAGSRPALLRAAATVAARLPACCCSRARRATGGIQLLRQHDVQKRVQDLDATLGGVLRCSRLPETARQQGDAHRACCDQAIDAFKAVLARSLEPPRRQAVGPSPEALADRIRRYDGDYDRPLAVQMEALLYALWATTPGADRVPHGEVCSKSVLRLETGPLGARCWRSIPRRTRRGERGQERRSAD